MAVVKASDTSITWNNLKGKKSCHTGVDRTAGWNIPMGMLYNRINHCKFGEQSWEGSLGGAVQKNRVLREAVGSGFIKVSFTKMNLKEIAKKARRGAELSHGVRMIVSVANDGVSRYTFSCLSHDGDQR